MHLTRKCRNKNKKYVKRRSIRCTSQRGRGGEEQYHKSSGKGHGVVDPVRDAERIAALEGLDYLGKLRLRVYGEYTCGDYLEGKKFPMNPQETIGDLKKQIKDHIRATKPNKSRYEFPLGTIITPRYNLSRIDTRQIRLTDEMTIGDVRKTYFPGQYEISINISNMRPLHRDSSTMKQFYNELGPPRVKSMFRSMKSSRGLSKVVSDSHAH
jgi:hypothetical protein